MAQIHLIPVEAAVSDDELMARVQAGSSGAFAALYDRYRARSYRVSHAVCHDRGRSEDAVQEAFISIWCRRDTYKPQQGTVAAWLLAVVPMPSGCSRCSRRFPRRSER